MPSQTDSAYAAAFGAGSDARVRGLSPAACPYPPGEKYLRDAWAAGWKDADAYYARDVKGRWPVRRLPPVRDAG